MIIFCFLGTFVWSQQKRVMGKVERFPGGAMDDFFACWLWRCWDGSRRPQSLLAARNDL